MIERIERERQYTTEDVSKGQVLSTARRKEQGHIYDHQGRIKDELLLAATPTTIDGPLASKENNRQLETNEDYSSHRKSVPPPKGRENSKSMLGLPTASQKNGQSVHTQNGSFQQTENIHPIGADSHSSRQNENMQELQHLSSMNPTYKMVKSNKGEDLTARSQKISIDDQNERFGNTPLLSKLQDSNDIRAVSFAPMLFAQDGASSMFMGKTMTNADLAEFSKFNMFDKSQTQNIPSVDDTSHLSNKKSKEDTEPVFKVHIEFPKGEKRKRSQFNSTAHESQHSAAHETISQAQRINRIMRTKNPKMKRPGLGQLIMKNPDQITLGPASTMSKKTTFDDLVVENDRRFCNRTQVNFAAPILEQQQQLFNLQQQQKLQQLMPDSLMSATLSKQVSSPSKNSGVIHQQSSILTLPELNNVSKQSLKEIKNSHATYKAFLGKLRAAGVIKQQQQQVHKKNSKQEIEALPQQINIAKAGQEQSVKDGLQFLATIQNEPSGAGSGGLNSHSMSPLVSKTIGQRLDQTNFVEVIEPLQINNAGYAYTPTKTQYGKFNTHMLSNISEKQSPALSIANRRVNESQRVDRFEDSNKQVPQSSLFNKEDDKSADAIPKSPKLPPQATDDYYSKEHVTPQKEAATKPPSPSQVLREASSNSKQKIIQATVSPTPSQHKKSQMSQPKEQENPIVKAHTEEASAIQSVKQTPIPVPDMSPMLPKKHGFINRDPSFTSGSQQDIDTVKFRLVSQPMQGSKVMNQDVPVVSSYLITDDNVLHKSSEKGEGANIRQNKIDIFDSFNEDLLRKDDSKDSKQIVQELQSQSGIQEIGTARIGQMNQTFNQSNHAISNLQGTTKTTMKVPMGIDTAQQSDASQQLEISPLPSYLKMDQASVVQAQQQNMSSTQQQWAASSQNQSQGAFQFTPEQFNEYFGHTVILQRAGNSEVDSTANSKQLLEQIALINQLNQSSSVMLSEVDQIRGFQSPQHQPIEKKSMLPKLSVSQRRMPREPLFKRNFQIQYLHNTSKPSQASRGFPQSLNRPGPIFIGQRSVQQSSPLQAHSGNTTLNQASYDNEVTAHFENDYSPMESNFQLFPPSNKSPLIDESTRSLQKSPSPSLQVGSDLSIPNPSLMPNTSRNLDKDWGSQNPLIFSASVVNDSMCISRVFKMTKKGALGSNKGDKKILKKIADRSLAYGKGTGGGGGKYVFGRGRNSETVSPQRGPKVPVSLWHQGTNYMLHTQSSLLGSSNADHFPSIAALHSSKNMGAFSQRHQSHDQGDPNRFQRPHNPETNGYQIDRVTEPQDGITASKLVDKHIKLKRVLENQFQQNQTVLNRTFNLGNPAKKLKDFFNTKRDTRDLLLNEFESFKDFDTRIIYDQEENKNVIVKMAPS